MDDNQTIVVRAFSGLDKEAAGAGCSTPPQFRSKMDNKANKKKREESIGRATAMKYGWKDPKSKKKAAITKEALVGNETGDAADVAVGRIESAAISSARDAVEKLAADGLDLAGNPFARHPSGVTNAQVSRVGALRSKAQAEKRKQKQISDVGETLNPEPNEAIKSALAKLAQGAPVAGQPDPYAAFEQMQQDGATVSKAIPGLDPNVVLQGQHMGVDMTPAGIKKRLGAHDMIAKGKKILRDDDQNGVPDVAEGAAGVGGQQQFGVGAQSQVQPLAQLQQDPALMIAAAKLRMPDLTKGSSADKQNTKKDDEGDETKPGVVKLESASDTPPKKAPEKKPEKESENEAEKKEAAIGPAAIGLGLRGLGLLSRAGAVPLRVGGRGMTAVGGKLRTLLPGLPRLGGAVETAGKKVTGAGRFSKLLGKLYRSIGKQLPKGETLTPTALTERVGPRFTSDALMGGGTTGLPFGENLRNILRGVGVGRKPELGARDALSLLGPAALGGGMLYGGARMLGGKEEPEGKEASLGAGVPPLKTLRALPRRDGFRTTNRQGVFNDLSRWSLGARM